MTTIRGMMVRTVAAGVALLAAPAPTLAHPGAGPAGLLHDLLHLSLLGADHVLRPAGILLLLLGGGILLATGQRESTRRASLRAAGSGAALVGLVLAFV